MNAINSLLLAAVTTFTPNNALAEGGTACATLTAPPPAFAAERPASQIFATPPLHAAAAQYSVGDLLPEEQLYVEMINRARANPVAEATLFALTTDPQVLQAYDFFNVDLALMQAQFATILPAPPVAPNALLRNAAIRHSTDMLSQSFQGHTGTDGSTPSTRVTATGYNWTRVGENVYATAENVFHGHAGFEVDWGFGVGGMQTPPGHRNSIHNANFREVGVGVVFGNNTPPPGNQPVGPQLVTQNFATASGNRPFITGVVYYDLNGNSFYDLGEGIGGVTVTVSGTTTQGITARSGGYAVPVAGNGTYTVTFSGPGLNNSVQQVTVANAENRKADFRPTYTPPAITGSTSPQINTPNSYSISAVGAANAYQFRSYQLTPAAVEGAENGNANITSEIFGYTELIQSVTKYSGASAFHLYTPQAAIREQSFTLDDRYIAEVGATLRFRSRLTWATTTTRSIVQVSTDDGQTWQEVYNRNGTDGPGESSFLARAIDLSSFAGSTIALRFVLLPTGGNYFDVDTGWFIDEILVEGANQISNVQESATLTAPNFTFQPTMEAEFVLQARARTGHDFLPWGPAVTVRSVQQNTTPATIQVSSFSVANGSATLEVDLLSGSVPTAWTLQSKASLDAGWATASTNVDVVSATRVRFTVPAAQPRQFFRIVATP